MGSIFFVQCEQGPVVLPAAILLRNVDNRHEQVPVLDDTSSWPECLCWVVFDELMHAHMLVVVHCLVWWIVCRRNWRAKLTRSMESKT